MSDLDLGKVEVWVVVPDGVSAKGDPSEREKDLVERA